MPRSTAERATGCKHTARPGWWYTPLQLCSDNTLFSQNATRNHLHHPPPLCDWSKHHPPPSPRPSCSFDCAMCFAVQLTITITHTHTQSRATTSLHTREERLQSKAKRHAMNSHAMGVRPSGRRWLGSECGAGRDRQLVAQANTNQQKSITLPWCCSAMMAHTHTLQSALTTTSPCVRAHTHTQLRFES
jgi:hypothetical protein